MMKAEEKPVLFPKLPDVCVRCATCMAACPVSRVTPRFPGPKQAGPGAQRFRSASEASVDDWIELCTSCHLCDMVCPAGVPISELNLMAKAKYLNERGRTFRDWLLVRSDLFGELAARFSKIVNPLMKNGAVRWLLDALLRIDRRRDLPGYEYPTFHRWFRTRPAPEGGRRKVAYFYGCFTNTNETDVGKAAVEVLEAHGLTVVVPPQRCCGIPRLGVGDLPGAREMGGRNIALLLPTVREGIDIVFSSTSCGLMLRHEYSRLLGLPALELLRLIPGLDVRLLEADCCGLGGLYGFKKEKFAIAEEIGKDLTEAVDRMKPDIILTDCEGCRMQIRHMTGLRVLHPLQLLRDVLPQPIAHP